MNLDQIRAELRAMKYKTDLIGAVDFEAIHKKLGAAKAKGDFLAAIDHCRAAAAAAPDDPTREKMRIEEVILLARIASLEEAIEKYDEYKLAEAKHPDARSLKARIYKDQAFVAPEDQQKELMEKSLKGYRAVLKDIEPGWDQQAYEFNGVNVATLAFFLKRLGEPKWWDETEEVRRTIRNFEPLDSYWSLATAAELHLIEGRCDEAALDIQRALACDDFSPDKKIATLAQFWRIDADCEAVAALRGGPCLHYSGHMIQPPGAETGRFLAEHEADVAELIRRELAGIDPSAVYGSLASGIDILLLEEVLRINQDRKEAKVDQIEVNLFFPFGLVDFFRASISNAGGDWGKRAQAILQAEKIVGPRFLSEDRALIDDDLAFGLTSRHAMGTAILEARRSRKTAMQLVAWDHEPATGPAGAAADLGAWPAGGAADLKQRTIDLRPHGRPRPPEEAPAAEEEKEGEDAPKPLFRSRDARALVFGDVKNFSKLSEEQLPIFVHHVLGAVKSALKASSGDDELLEFSNTWGDGVFAVFKTAAAAAHFALDLQNRMEELKARMERERLGEERRLKKGADSDDEAAPVKKRRPPVNLPPDLAIRLGLHFGAVYRLREPVTGRDNYFGEAVARAARIEPITREGRIFVSEEFASELALDPNSPAEAEYVGERDAAKNYGRFRLYRIRPKTG